MPRVVTTEMAREAWKYAEYGKKDKKYYDALTDEQRRAYWQYSKDNNLTDVSKLGPGALAEYKKYVLPNTVMYQEKSYNSVANLNVIDPDKATMEGAYTKENLAQQPSISPLAPIAPKKVISGRQLEDYTDTPIQPLAKTPITSPRMLNKSFADTPLTKKVGAGTYGLVNNLSLGGLDLATRTTGSESAKQAVEQGKKDVLTSIPSMKSISNPRSQGAPQSKAFDTKAVDVKTYDVGALVGMGLSYTALEKMAGEGLIKIAENKIIPLTEKAISILKGTVAKGAVAGGTQQAVTDINQGASLKQTAIDTGIGIVAGGIIDKGLSGASKLFKGDIKPPALKPIATIETPSPLSNTNVLPKMEIPVKPAVMSEAKPATSEIGKQIETEMEGAAHTSNDFIKQIAPTIKDAKLGGSFGMTDIYRNFKHAYGKNFEAVKKSVLDPFDAAKKAYVDEQKAYTDDLYNNVVKKLGIGKDTKESAAVQWFGEGKKMTGVEEIIDPQTGQKIKKAKEVPYTLDDLKKDFPGKWQNIVEADKWFRKSYNELIDKVNASVAKIYPGNAEKLVPKRTDYYRHTRDMSETFSGLRNIFDSPANIDPKLIGVSEWTAPKTKWQSFKQKRGLGEYKADAVNGFLDYIKAASYSTHIDPQINVFRSMAKDIAESTEKSKNANNFIGFLRNFANDLSGKTNQLDRPFQDIANRQVFNIINAANGRIKKNTVLMNAKSALSQFANIPLGVAKVKNPIHITQGVGETLAGFIGKGKAPNAYKQSQFISERYADKLYRRFNTKLLDQPENFASWLLETADELGTKMIFNSVHNQAIAQGIKNPIKHADDVTRALVSGRGLGEVPLLQKAKLFQLVSPFNLEVANQWHVMKDFINEKDFAAIPILLLGNYLFNNATESVTGARVTFDPINAMIQAMGEKNTTPLQKVGRLGGEVLSNIPLGSTIAAQLPDAVKQKYLGRNDPTRFGTGLMLTKGLQDPLYKLLPPMGGGQIKKTIEGLKSTQILPKDLKGNKQVVSGSYNGNKLRFPIEKTPSNVLKSALFGQYSSPEAVNYFKNNSRELSAEQTKQLERWTKNGGDPKVFYNNILREREIDKLKTELSNTVKNDKLNIKKAQEIRDKINELIKQGW